MSRIKNYTSTISEIEAPILQDLSNMMAKHQMTITELEYATYKLKKIAEEKPMSAILTDQDLSLPMLTTAE